MYMGLMRFGHQEDPRAAEFLKQEVQFPSKGFKLFTKNCILLRLTYGRFWLVIN